MPVPVLPVPLAARVLLAADAAGVSEFELKARIGAEVAALREQMAGTGVDVVRKGGGSVDNVDIWGRRRLAYDIKKKNELVIDHVSQDQVI